MPEQLTRVPGGLGLGNTRLGTAGSPGARGRQANRISHTELARG